MAGPPGAGKKMEGVDNLELGEKQKEEMLRHLTSIANDTQDMMMKGGLARDPSHRPPTGAAGGCTMYIKLSHNFSEIHLLIKFP